MSTASKLVLGVSVVLTVSTVIGVHLKQSQDQQKLREGVVRDLERLRRKRENLEALEEQIKLTQKLVLERERQEAARGS
ncbi:protein PET117 homolog, mitochondrial [Astyanax mexicanus]|uniref:PET117 cytochrome c oxidase chaperone n=2 Tax=Astyanax mexicanus TaxID=7994 RepID=A0A8T2KTL9_ASTMX|nr:protein PET117 homolog, mitochondrial [Astyanax mexicanus]XP_022521116.1 protein PET117 homolog, mitochondrial [Astyanax mexicanus]KAG9261185.1 hypothetical protein AMEX_G26173 [Astyanax mexicanus]